MKNLIYKVKLVVLACSLLGLSSNLFAQDAAQKTIAIGDVEAGYETAGQNAYDLKETIQLGLKKQLEKIGKGKYAIDIVSPSVVTPGQEPETMELSDMPTDRPPTQKDMARYMAAMQRMQKQLTGQLKTHKPVAADAYFDFRVVSGQTGVDTGGAASTIGGLAGVDTSIGNISTKKTEVNIVATMRDPKTGTPIDKYTAKATSVKVRNIGGYTSYDFGSDEMTRERLFSSAVKDCAKWIASKVQ